MIPKYGENTYNFPTLKPFLHSLVKKNKISLDTIG